MTASTHPRQTWSLEVEGMRCASCVQHVEEALRGVPGVVGASVNLATREARVTGEPGRVSAEQLVAAVAHSGYKALPTTHAPHPHAEHAHGADHRERRAWLRRTVVGAALLAVVVAIPWLVSDHAWALAVQWTAATILQGYVGWPFYQATFAQLRRGQVTMDTLVALGATAGYAAATVEAARGSHSMYLHDPGMILTVISLGRYLEALVRARASRAISALLELAPPVAWKQVDGRPRETPVEDVNPGEVILVRPGDRVPLDAVVLTGHSALDQSWLTGEAAPVERGPGDEIAAGTLNGPGALTARVIRPAAQSAIARVAELVRQAQASKLRLQRLADRVVAWFVPAVLVVAAAAFAGWLLLGQPAAGASAAVAVLVVACPCALGLAAPMAVLVAGGLGAQRGIFLRNAAALETARRLDTILLDKTGTITLGQLQLDAVLPAEHQTVDGLLTQAASAERQSSHPLAAAIVDAARQRGLSLLEAHGLRVEPGAGVEAQVEGRSVLVGHERLLRRRAVEVDEVWQRRIDALREQGQTPLAAAVDGRLAGLLVMADTVAPEAADAVAELRRLGLDVKLLSGDARTTVASVAASVGIPAADARAEVLPAEKQNVVRELQDQGRRVAMVGDGINDAPALAAADLGLAIGAGADVAIEAADVVLARRDLRLAPQSIELARATYRTIVQNLAWAFVFNALLIPAAALGRVPPAAAAAAMASSSLLVVGNSLLLTLRFRPRAHVRA